MAAKIIKGGPIAEEIRAELAQEVESLKAKGIVPKLSVVLVGDDPGSVWYARNKVKTGEKVGVVVEVHELAADTPEVEVVGLVEKLNADPDVHGILVELPLPAHIDKARVMNAIAPAKDVDGVTAVNRGYVLGGQEDLALVPATPLSCIELIQRSGVEIKGKRVTVVGRGDTVGRPLAMLLLQKGRDATVTVCHSRTQDLAGACRWAEILVAAAGAGADHLIKADMISPGAVVIDAAINEKPDGSITGDVDFEAAKEVAGAITPVPGGVGSLTTTIIMGNTVKALKLQKGLA
ncbi:bifunctional 5,10-methylenetetrahydrofolate dehydrogenase/5,10-methenyltetrahydrofolate cyclohydrolase [Deferrisoma camini]|uniref:bifunctional 5,10-methylenetetrahydrofolate dehydrogenase/5,10-methenyltetrahydrofolate cyclohydrolase n=1 Tax=Deferrisoma camini TaxID=1035120 RepID=UPI00046CFAAC|nr:bifunctional 5,10-methylenetetrahydrofolate dehydrogenase/5,10-methenyltetrahydrofolate cyclohydrolase [Deferrisoma camini]